MNITVDCIHVSCCKYFRLLFRLLVVDIEIKISDDGFQSTNKYIVYQSRA